MTYDQKVYELAEHFLQDTRYNTPAVADKLAQIIQHEIEDWLEWYETGTDEKAIDP